MTDGTIHQARAPRENIRGSVSRPTKTTSTPLSTDVAAIPHVDAVEAFASSRTIKKEPARARCDDDSSQRGCQDCLTRQYHQFHMICRCGTRCTRADALYTYNLFGHPSGGLAVVTTSREVENMVDRRRNIYQKSKMVRMDMASFFNG